VNQLVCKQTGAKAFAINHWVSIKKAKRLAQDLHKIGYRPGFDESWLWL